MFFSFGFDMYKSIHSLYFDFHKWSSLKCIQSVLSFIYNPNKLIKAKTDRKIERIKITGALLTRCLSMNHSRRIGIECLLYLSSYLLQRSKTKYNDQKHYSVYGLVNQSGYGIESIVIDEHGYGIPKNKPRANETADAMIIYREIYYDIRITKL